MEMPVETKNARRFPILVPSQVMKKITPKVETAPSVPAYPANSAPRA